MERVGTLINKLKEQFQQNDDAAKLLMTTQMLVAELQLKQASNNTGKVAVIMPYTNHHLPNTAEEIADAANLQSVVKETTTKTVDTKVANPKQTNKKDDNLTGWLFDPSIASIPTLAHQDTIEPIKSPSVVDKEIFELKDTFVFDEATSLNDKLKENVTEIASTIVSTPIKDLRKAIGINDRYLFINELFRGDEDMYERSIKTINGFQIFAEAEYWIQRELKVKLGWLDTQETVKAFDQLVKRRFS